MENPIILTSHKSIGDGENNYELISKFDEPWKFGIWCDTYNGEKNVDINWWCLQWDTPRLINVIQFRQGPISESGGWWRSINVEYQLNEKDAWNKINYINIVPEYCFDNYRINRKPYSLYTIIFPTVKCSKIRIIGQPGGIYPHTKIGHFSASYKDLSIWSPNVEISPPLPQILQVLSPQTLFNFLYRLYPICEIFFTLVIGKINLIYFLDDVDYDKYKKLSETTALNSEYWRKIYNLEGAIKANTKFIEFTNEVIRSRKSNYFIREDGLIQIICPVVFDGQLLGVLKNYSMIRYNTNDSVTTKNYLKCLGVNEEEYYSYYEKIPIISQQKLDSLVLFVESITSMITNVLINSTMFHDNYKNEQYYRKISNQEIVNNSIQFMRNNIDQNVSGIEIASRYSFSYGHYVRIFKKAMGISPKQYLMGLRFERAIILLKTTELPLIDICLSCGFKSVSSFVRDFHKKYGITPEKYRLTFNKEFS